MVPRETENSAYENFGGDKQGALWYVVVYALLTYGNMPVHPRLRVKILLKFKY